MAVFSVERPVAPAQVPRPGRRPVSIRMLSLSFGALTAVVAFAGSWIPSFWGDEAASIMSAQRSLPSLFSMLGTIDAVHGSYYLLLHFWIDLFGASPLSVRLPSALAVGIAAAGTVLLAEQLFSRRIAVVTGIVCAVLPRFTFMGSEARSYALATAAAVWLTVLFVRLLATRDRRRLAWLGYALGFAVGIYLFLYLGLMAVVHGIALLSSRRNRDVLRRWLSAVVAGLLLASPVIFWALREHNQIGFLARRHRVDVLIIIAQQWFGSLWLAVPCWALVIWGCVVTFRRWRRGKDAIPGEESRESGMVLVLAWFAVPTVLILIGNYVIQPMYTDRYLSFSAPAAVILVAVGVAALPFAWTRLAAVMAIVALAAPVYISQRTEFGKPGGSDWAQASAVIGRLARPGDGIVFDETVKPSWRPRLAMHLYPDDYQGLDDIALTLPYQESSGLRDHVAPLSRLLPRLDGVSTVWDMETTQSNDTSPTANLPVLERHGFTVIRTVKLHRTIIYELTRSIP